jgi:DNA (cytosine-5)-methyltransferase 1
MNVASLFSGIGGFDLGLERAGHTILWQCEIDLHARAVLKRHWPKIECREDVRDVKGEAGTVDILCGGFPCQDVSRGGRHEGLAGARSGLWFEFERLIGELRPAWVVIENVPGLLSSNQGRDFARILRGLDERGYYAAWRVFDSRYFGVPQRRRRVYLVADRRGSGAEVLFEPESSGGDRPKAARKGRYAVHPAHADTAWWDGGSVSQTLDAVLAKKQALPEKQRFPALRVVPWMPCPDCDDYWCRLHGMHAYDCPCPAIDVWAAQGLSPYEASALRWLTPEECELLQGFPECWTVGVPDTARYRLVGNAVTVNVAEWIGKRLA